MAAVLIDLSCRKAPSGGTMREVDDVVCRAEHGPAESAPARLFASRYECVS